jgi:SecD/SecF fusion protein
MPMPRLHLVPVGTRFPFMRWRNWAFLLTGAMMLLAFAAIAVRGFNFGIDFAGGIVIEVRTPQAADLGAIRSKLSGLNLGEIALQEFGSPNDVLVRVQRQEGGDEAQKQAVDKVSAALREQVGEGISFRRTEFVGPKVSGELIEGAAIATLISLVGIMLYVWFRFEWQFGIGAAVTTVHDVVMTLGFFAVTGLEFNLSSVAAVLTVMGYSINDTVVVYDRIRENLRKYKAMPLEALIDLCINETLSRTTMTVLTTLLSLFALVIFGGEVIRSFCASMIFGIVIGTYSSIFVAAPLLIHLKLRRGGEGTAAADQPASAGTA